MPTRLFLYEMKVGTFHNFSHIRLKKSWKIPIFLQEKSGTPLSHRVFHRKYKGKCGGMNRVFHNAVKKSPLETNGRDL
jgi:hypothetical protein